jgi:hypothetical protein
MIKIIETTNPQEKTMTNLTTDLTTLSGAELLALYNLHSPTKRKAKFQTKDEAIARVKSVLPAAKPAKEPKADKPAKAAKAPKTTKASGKNAKVIRIKTADGENPRRPGTDAFTHFEKMKGGVDIETYLSAFEDRRKARQWLWNTIRDGHVEVLG